MDKLHQSSKLWRTHSDGVSPLLLPMHLAYKGTVRKPIEEVYHSRAALVDRDVEGLDNIPVDYVSAPRSRQLSSEEWIPSFLRTTSDLHENNIGTWQREEAIAMVQQCEPAAVRPLIDYATWCLKVSGMSTTLTPVTIRDYFESFGSIVGVYIGRLLESGSVVVGFYDIRDAIACAESIASSRLTYIFCEHDEAKRIAVNGRYPFAFQLEATIAIEGTQLRQIHPEYVLRQFGEIKTCRISRVTDTTILCTYFDVRNARKALGTLNSEHYTRDWFRVARCFEEELDRPEMRPSADLLLPEEPPPLRKKQFSLWSPSQIDELSRELLQQAEFIAGPVQRPQRATAPMMIRSLTQPTTATYSNNNTVISLGSQRMRSYLQALSSNIGGEQKAGKLRLPPTATMRSPSASSVSASSRGGTDDDYNVVKVSDVMNGKDRRTTVMIKNVPNKYSQQMLKEYLDETNAKTYDFLYLRMDFTNKCNVGYAFVNFTDPSAIAVLARARVGQRWTMFKSDKIMELGYANIQGKNKLIDKFRNSVVMDEPPSFRPKIYYSNGPLQGEEEEYILALLTCYANYHRFPVPNSEKRKQKSAAGRRDIGYVDPLFSLC